MQTAAPDAIFCRSTNGVQALVWNFTSLHQDKPDKNYFTQDLPAGKYQYKVFGVGYRLYDVYADYLDLGSPLYLSPAQLEQLKNKSDGHSALNQVVQIGPGGNFEWHLLMRENDVFLVSLSQVPGN